MGGDSLVEYRDSGKTWDQCAKTFGLGSETAARRAYKRMTLPLQGKHCEVVTLDDIKTTSAYVPPVPRGLDPVIIRGEGTQLQRVLFVPDMHIPYENHLLWSLMLNSMYDFGPDIIVVIGDFGDWKAVSSHLKDPKDWTRLKWEVQCQRARLDQLEGLGAEHLIYIAGNHEDRLQRYLQEKAPALFDFLNVPQILKLEECGWKYTPYKEYAKVGALHVTHDVGTAGVGAVRKAMDTFAHSVVTGHSHRLGYVVEGDATGEARVSASFGWGGDIEYVDYMSRARASRDWATAFGIGYLNPATQAVHLVPVPLVGRSIVVEGKLYTEEGA